MHSRPPSSTLPTAPPAPAPAPDSAAAEAVQDVVVLRDFVADYSMLPTQDIYLQSAEKHFGRANSHCTGVMFIRPTTSTRELIEATTAELIKCMATSACTDQEALNAVVLAREVNVGRLAPADYPGARSTSGWSRPTPTHSSTTSRRARSATRHRYSCITIGSSAEQTRLSASACTGCGRSAASSRSGGGGTRAKPARCNLARRWPLTDCLVRPKSYK